MRRFTIARLMIVVGFCAVALAAWHGANDIWAGIMMSLLFLALGTAALGAIQRRGAKRAFWLGFLIYGAGYATLAFVPWFSEQIAPKLPVSQVVAQIYWRISESSGRLRQEFPDDVLAELRKMKQPQRDRVLRRIFTSTGNYNQSLQVGHSITAITLAFLGGAISRWFYYRQARDDAKPMAIAPNQEAAI